MESGIWPFLVANSPRNEYRAVVAPDFLCQEGVEQVLKLATGTETSGNRQGYLVRMTGLQRGANGEDLWLAFRTVEPERGTLGIGEASRREKLTEGFVLRQKAGKAVAEHRLSLTEENFDELRQLCLAAYQTYWKDERAQPPTFASPELELGAQNPGGERMTFGPPRDFAAGGYTFHPNPKGFQSLPPAPTGVVTLVAPTAGLSSNPAPPPPEPKPGLEKPAVREPEMPVRLAPPPPLPVSPTPRNQGWLMLLLGLVLGFGLKLALDRFFGWFGR